MHEGTRLEALELHIRSAPQYRGERGTVDAHSSAEVEHGARGPAGVEQRTQRQGVAVEEGRGDVQLVDRGWQTFDQLLEHRSLVVSEEQRRIGRPEHPGAGLAQGGPTLPY